MENKWLDWSSKIQSIAQAGLAYSKDKYDIERFQQLLELAAEITSEYTDVEFKVVKDLFDKEEGYLTPKVDVRAAIIRNDKILLVKESLDGCFSLPGGWADVNLSVSENIIKESREEAGADVIPQRVIAILDRNRYNKPRSIYSIYKIFVLCELVNIKFEANTETDECGFYSLDNLPMLSEERNTIEQINMCFEAYKNSDFKTIFD